MDNKDFIEISVKDEILKNAQKIRKRKRFMHNLKKEVLDWTIHIVLCFALAFLLNETIYINATVPTGSMETTIPTGSRLFGSRLSYINKSPERGDIVIFWAPEQDNILYVKRVIGLPNDVVEIKDGMVYINNKPYEEDYVKDEMADWGPIAIPEGKYFVLGDNRSNSHDARYWNTPYIDEDTIIAKAIFCYWPRIFMLK